MPTIPLLPRTDPVVRIDDQLLLCFTVVYSSTITLPLRLSTKNMAETSVLRSKSHAKGVQDGKRVETVNSLHAREFFHTYYPIEARASLAAACSRHLPALKPLFRDAEGVVHLGFFEACFDLIEETSATDYNNSETKWSSPKKKKEMALPDMKYIVLLDSESFAPDDPETLPVAGFVSFMITYEDNHEVVYVYEIHFEEKWRRFGLGKELMRTVEEIGRRVGVEKTMLTVFKANNGALEFYQRLGYSEDEFSPGPRELRNGTVKEPSYTILSKPL